MANRLADETSPYLRQHADNPVDWWPWRPEAFEEARRRDVPMLLSVGYSACHWCHVMAHETFESEEVAQVLNDGFVSVKVDREERPDVDAVYMSATTAMTGQGGWPMTVVMTPDGAPFFCGTYFPRPQFLQLLEVVGRAWREQRLDLVNGGARVAEAVRSLAAAPGPASITEATLEAAARRLAEDADAAHGGFGTAPKFPPSMVLAFLLRHHARTGDAASLRLVAATCESMARGGIYDQLAGGFARYSVDRAWVVPHFEKMLYDNAQLARVYGAWFRAGGGALAERISRETAEFLIRDLGTDEGGFAAALDADTEGVEGATYVWTRSQLHDVLGAADGATAGELLAVTPGGTFEHGTSTLQLPADPADEGWWQGVRSRLLAARTERPQPARDDKVVASWNGLAIAALAELGALLPEPRYVAAAERAAQFLLTTHQLDGRLRRTSRAGVVGDAPGVADDYGNLAEGLLALHQATGRAHWLAAAGELLDTAIEYFGAPGGGFHDAADDAEALLARPVGLSDNAEPSGTAALAGALLGYGTLAGSPTHLARASAATEAAGAVVERDPRFAGWTLAVAEARVAGPLQVAVVGDGPDAERLAATARAADSPGLLVTVGLPDAPGIPALADRPLAAGRPAAYVCRGPVCSLPPTDPSELARALAVGELSG